MSKHISRWILALLVSTSLLGTGGSTHQPAVADRIQGVLLQLAQQQPDTLVNVIVQKSEQGSSTAEALVAQLGGTVTRSLGIINAFAAQMPASAVNELGKSSTITWVSLDSVVRNAQETPGVWQEDFNYSAVSQADPLAWPSGWDWTQQPWIEIGEGDGPVAGDVAISSFMAGELQGLRLQAAGKGLQSAADLSLSASASLTLAYRRKGLADTDWVSVQASTDGGATWVEIGRLAGPATDDVLQTATFDLGAYLSPTFMLRFLTADTFSADARLYIDFARIDYVSTLVPVETVFEGAQTNLLYLPTTLKTSQTTATDAAATSELEAAQYGFNWLYTYDTFDAISYSNNVGSVAWETNWIEDDVAGNGPNKGNIQVYAGELWMDDNPDTLTQPSIRREVNLTGALEAYLYVDYRTTSGVDWDDRVVLEISKNKGVTYTTLATAQNITGVYDSYSWFDITPYISADTVIRFRVLSNFGATNESMVLDNVYISYTTVCPSCVDTSHLAGASIQSVGADKVWNQAPYHQGEGVAVAVVDSGIAWHDDLWSQNWDARIVGSVNFADEWAIDDLNGHGTHVAGLIAGDGYMSDGAYMGVAPQVNLVDVKVLNDSGMGYLSDVVAGLQWVNDNKNIYNIRVVNLSLNSTVQESYHQSPLDAALEILWFNGVVVVVSAGNNGKDSATRGTLLSPANDPFVISVGAVEDKGTASLADDKLANFSGYGTVAGQVKPDLVAPGSDRVSLLASEDSNLAVKHPLNKVAGWAGYNYFKMSGTSMAAPLVSGAVALLLQDEPTLTPDQVKYRLIATANKNWGGYDPTAGGAPYLDVYAAVMGTTTQSANTGLQASQMLWSGAQPITWGSVNWNSVNWNSVNWNSVNWNSVNWNSVNWNSDYAGP